MIRLPFTGNPLDRADHERRDPDWLQAQVASPAGRFLALRDLQLLATGSTPAQLVWLNREALSRLPATPPPLLLGLRDGIPHFAVDVSGVDDLPVLLGLEGASFVEARPLTLQLAAEDGGIVAQARSLTDWHKRHGFCPVCGQATSLRSGGASRQCDSCGAEHFPRTDPAVIMVVWSGERCLLGHNARWNNVNYSSLAGYVEQGESIEEAVAREVKEEVGLTVDRVTYYASQPWPFPSSLMIGCFAHVDGEDVSIDVHEIGDARWFTRQEVLAGLDDPDPARGYTFPDRAAIAHHLIRAWVTGPGASAAFPGKLEPGSSPVAEAFQPRRAP